MVGHFDYEQRCRIEKNVPIALILPSRWRYGAESLGMERTSCLWYKASTLDHYVNNQHCPANTVDMKLKVADEWDLEIPLAGLSWILQPR